MSRLIIPVNQPLAFTGDEHYNHEKIIVYCDRPFPDKETMNEVMITRHNEVITPNHLVIHLGDFAFKSFENIIPRLNGRHILIKGNHDRKLSKKARTGFEAEHTVLEVQVGTQKIFLSHYNHVDWPEKNRGSWHLYGHSHSKTHPFNAGLKLDVGVDGWDYYPVSFATISAIMSNRSLFL